MNNLYEDKPHSCLNCGRNYKKRCTLNRHIRYECGSARKSLVCYLCGRLYTRPDTLIEHIQKHDHEKLMQEIKHNS